MCKKMIDKILNTNFIKITLKVNQRLVSCTGTTLFNLAFYPLLQRVRSHTGDINLKFNNLHNFNKGTEASSWKEL